MRDVGQALPEEGVRRTFGAERRRHRRFHPRICEFSLRVRAGGLLGSLLKRSQDVEATVLDLSEGGARLIAHGRCTRGGRVEVLIQVKLFQDVLGLPGTVVWCADHAEKSGYMRLGVRFRDLDPVEARKIAALRDYVGSPEFRQKESVRRRLRRAGDASDLELES